MPSHAAFGFGLARSLDFDTAVTCFTEFCELLSQAVGCTFFPHHALSYAELSAGLERGELGLAWTPPIPAIDLQDRNAATFLVAPVRKGSTFYHSAFITRPTTEGPRSDRVISSPSRLAELKGKRVGWVDRESATGYLLPRMYLSGEGYDLSAFFGQEHFLGSHNAVIDSVVRGAVDVGATFCKLETHSGRIVQAAWTASDGTSRAPIEVIATVGPIPNDVILASSKLPPELRTRVFRWLLDPDTKRAREVLVELVRAESCRATTPSHYEPLRRMIAAAASHGEAPWRTKSSPSWRPPPVG